MPRKPSLSLSSSSEPSSELSFSTYYTSSTSVTSSSPEPSPTSSTLHRYDVATEISLILELEGWSVEEVAYLGNTYGRQRCIKLYLEKECRVVKHCTTNPTLHEAIKDVSWSYALEQLAHLGAKITDHNCRGDTAVHLGFVHDATDGVFDALLEMYLKDTTENFTNADGLSLLHIACAKASLDKVWKMLDRFPEDLNRPVALKTRTQFSGYTCLHFAVLYGRYEVAQMLLQRQADFCARDRHSATPLHLALYCEDTEMIDLILAYDRKWENCVNNFGLTHLMAACAGTSSNIVNEFLRVSESQRKIPPSSLVKFSVINSIKYPFAGYTPLHFAAKNGNSDTVQLLLKHGASTYAVTASNYTASSLATMEGHEKVCRLVQKYSDRRHTDAMLVKQMENLEVAGACASSRIFNGVAANPSARPLTKLQIW